MTLIDGHSIAAQRRAQLAQEITKNFSTPPHLTVILVGDDPASAVYVRKKNDACLVVGITSTVLTLPAATTEAELLKTIQRLNQDATVHGILVQLPLPAHIHSDRIMMAIHPLKDVDGLHPENVGLLNLGQPRFVSCTPAGIMTLLNYIGYDCTGKEAVILGRSRIVGRPMAALLLSRNATVTICHRHTAHLPDVCQRADLLVAAVGVPHLVQRNWVKSGACVIDVGVNRLPDGRLTGDVDFENVRDIASWITPVPKGVGPMTIVSLLENTLQAFKLQHQE